MLPLIPHCNQAQQNKSWNSNNKHFNPIHTAQKRPQKTPTTVCVQIAIQYLDYLYSKPSVLRPVQKIFYGKR